MIIGCLSVFNEAEKIKQAIESLSFCDRVIVVDGAYTGYPIQGRSSDGTRRIAKRCGAEVIAGEGLTQVEQRNLCFEAVKDDCYFIVLDADEEFRGELPELKEEAYRVKHTGYRCILPTIRVFKSGVRYAGAHNFLWRGDRILKNEDYHLLDTVGIHHLRRKNQTAREATNLKYFLYQIDEERPAREEVNIF